MALLEHVDTWKPPGGRDEGLLHAGRVHELSLLDCAGGKITCLLTLAQEEEGHGTTPNVCSCKHVAPDLVLPTTGASVGKLRQDDMENMCSFLHLSQD